MTSLSSRRHHVRARNCHNNRSILRGFGGDDKAPHPSGAMKRGVRANPKSAPSSAPPGAGGWRATSWRLTRWAWPRRAQACRRCTPAQTRHNDGPDPWHHAPQPQQKTYRAASEFATKPRAAVSFGAFRISIPPPPPETSRYASASP